jgi:hypothetical protein
MTSAPETMAMIVAMVVSTSLIPAKCETHAIPVPAVAAVASTSCVFIVVLA